MITRHEEVLIRLEIDSNKYNEYTREISTITDIYFTIHDKDTVQVNFNFNIDYFNNIEKKFEALEKLIDDPAIIKDAKINELYQTRTLIYDIFTKLDRIIRKVQ